MGAGNKKNTKWKINNLKMGGERGKSHSCYYSTRVSTPPPFTFPIPPLQTTLLHAPPGACWSPHQVWLRDNTCGSRDGWDYLLSRLPCVATSAALEEDVCPPIPTHMWHRARRPTSDIVAAKGFHFRFWRRRRAGSVVRSRGGALMLQAGSRG